MPLRNKKITNKKESNILTDTHIVLSDRTNQNMAWRNRLRDKKPTNFYESNTSTENEESKIKEIDKSKDELKPLKDEINLHKPIYMRQMFKENKSPPKDSNIYKFDVDESEKLMNKKRKGKTTKRSLEDSEIERIEKRFKKNQQNILKQIKGGNNKNQQKKKNLTKKLKDKPTNENNDLLPIQESKKLHKQHIQNQQEKRKENENIQSKQVKSPKLLNPLTENFNQISPENKNFESHSSATSHPKPFNTPRPICNSPNFENLTPLKNNTCVYQSTPILYPRTSTPFHSVNYPTFKSPKPTPSYPHTSRQTPINPQTPRPNFNPNYSEIKPQTPIQSPMPTPSILSNRPLSRLMDSRESSLNRSRTQISEGNSGLFGFDNISEEIKPQKQPQRQQQENKQNLKDLRENLAKKMAPFIKPTANLEESNYDNDCEYEESFLATPKRKKGESKFRQKKLEEYDQRASDSFFANTSFHDTCDDFSKLMSPHLFEDDLPQSYQKPPRKSYEREKRKVKFVAGEVISLDEYEAENSIESEEPEETLSFEEPKKKTKKKTKQDKINEKLIQKMNKEFSAVDNFELFIE